MYSQRGEDEVLINLFGDHVGRFLDIGAYDGKENSNTWWAVEKGWGGLMVEPSSLPFEALKKNRATLPKEQQARIELLNVGIHTTAGLYLFHESPDQVSTFDQKHYEVWKEVGQFVEVWKYCITVSDLLNQFGGGYDLISIDAEGLSVDILFSFPLAEMIPKCVVVEHNGDRLVEVGELMMGKLHYTQIFVGGENAIFVR